MHTRATAANTPRESKVVLLSRDEIDAIEKITVGQADNEAWLQQREGRITASSFSECSLK